MYRKSQKVFVDATTLIQGGKPPGGPALVRLKDLVNAELVTVLTTDITRDEVAKKHSDNEYKIVKDIARPHFRKIIEELQGVTLCGISARELKDVLLKKHTKSTEAMFVELGFEKLDIDTVSPMSVFSAYAKGEGFFSREIKKNQFSDAFVFERLKMEATDEDPVIIVSDDRDFEIPTQVEPNISLVTSLPELFQELGLGIEEPNIEDFFHNHQAELIDAVAGELEQWGLVGDIEDSEIEDSEILAVEPSNYLSFRSIEEQGPILVIGSLSVDANVTYNHPDWDTAIYDNEDGRSYPFRHVSGHNEVSFEVDVSISLGTNDSGVPNSIEKLNFRNDGFQFVDLNPMYSDW